MLSALLLAIYVYVRANPIPFGDHPDIRERLFGVGLARLEFALAVALIVVGVRLFDFLLFDFSFRAKRKEAAPGLLRQLVSLVLYIGLIAYAAKELLGTDVRGVLLGGTVIAAVLGLAMQDTLGNLFSGIALHVEKTYEVGDVVRLNEVIGTVEWVSWRATRIRTTNNSILTVPNSVLARESIEVFSRQELNARLVSVTAGFEHAPARIISLLERACHNLEHVATEIPAIARVAEIGERGLVYEVKYWTRAYHLRETIDAEVRRAIWYAFHRDGIRMPFPVRAIARFKQTAGEGLSLQKILERLENVDVFAPLSAEEKRVLSEATRVETFGRGETILSAGEGGASMFIIDDGLVSIRRSDAEGGGELAQLGAGEMFGEIALLTGEPRQASVVALTDVVAFEIAKRSLQPILKQNPALVESISKVIVERRSSTAAVHAENGEAAQKSLFGRIADWFAV